MIPARLLLFDLDGTLIDSLGDITAAVNHALKDRLSAPLSREQVCPHVGRGAANLISGLLNSPDPRSPEVQDRLQVFLAYYRSHLTVFTRPYPGVPQLLARLDSLPRVVISNKPAELARGALQSLGLAHHFEAIYGGESFGRRKPDPLPLLEAMKPFPGPLEQVIMIGDSPMDVLAGQRAGVQTCAARYGLTPASDLQALNPTFCIDKPLELLDHIRPR